MLGMHSMLTRAYDTRHLKLAGLWIHELTGVGNARASVKSIVLTLKISKNIRVCFQGLEMLWNRTLSLVSACSLPTSDPPASARTAEWSTSGCCAIKTQKSAA